MYMGMVGSNSVVRVPKYRSTFPLPWGLPGVEWIK